MYHWQKEKDIWTRQFCVFPFVCALCVAIGADRALIAFIVNPLYLIKPSPIDWSNSPLLLFTSALVSVIQLSHQNTLFPNNRRNAYRFPLAWKIMHWHNVSLALNFDPSFCKRRPQGKTTNSCAPSWSRILFSSIGSHLYFTRFFTTACGHLG